MMVTNTVALLSYIVVLDSIRLLLQFKMTNYFRQSWHYSSERGCGMEQEMKEEKKTYIPVQS